MVRLLLEAGANPLAEGWSGRPLGDDTPLARARDREQPEIVRLLEDAAANALTDLPARPEAPPDSLDEIERAMSKCGHKGDIKGALALLEQHPTLAYAGLYEAVHQGHTKLARLLLERGADPTKPWRWSCWLTPLMHSLRHDRPNYEMASMLMDHGVTANDANGMGMTILHILVGLGTPAARGVDSRSRRRHQPTRQRIRIDALSMGRARWSSRDDRVTAFPWRIAVPTRRRTLVYACGMGTSPRASAHSETARRLRRSVTAGETNYA
jgi:ankyrin repeat protein